MIKKKSTKATESYTEEKNRIFHSNMKQRPHAMFSVSTVSVDCDYLRLFLIEMTIVRSIRIVGTLSLCSFQQIHAWEHTTIHFRLYLNVENKTSINYLAKTPSEKVGNLCLCCWRCGTANRRVPLTQEKCTFSNIISPRIRTSAPNHWMQRTRWLSLWGIRCLPSYAYPGAIVTVSTVSVFHFSVDRT